MYTNIYNDELCHYGVIGMKWGVRRGRADQVYAKASKKLAKYDAKATKYQQKAIKSTAKADSKFFNRDAHRDIAARANRKAVKNMKKAEKMVNKMNKALKGTSIKLTPEQTAMGRRYVDSLNMRAAISAYR